MNSEEIVRIESEEEEEDKENLRICGICIGYFFLILFLIAISWNAIG
jgi:hypothetical protein